MDELNKEHFKDLSIETDQRTFEIIKENKRKNQKELSLFYLKTDVCRPLDVCEKFIRISF